MAQTSTAKVYACNGTIIEGFFFLLEHKFFFCLNAHPMVMCMGAHVLGANLTFSCVKISSQSSNAPVFHIMFC
jgi:hypothetical protein